MLTQSQNLDPERILDEFNLILALEEKAALTYSQLAKDCDDSGAREILFAISRQEQAHVEIAKTLFQLVSAWMQKNRESEKFFKG